MITDEMLQKAVQKAHDALIDALPEPQNCKHEFSKRFKRKMRRLIRRTKYRTIYNILKAVACFFLIVTLASAMFLSANVKAREAFFAWVKEKYKFFVEYYFDSPVSGETIATADMPEYRLGWVPDGYVEDAVSSSHDMTIITYKGDDNTIITFTYRQNPTSTNLFFKENLYTHYNLIFDNTSADIYITNVTNEANIIIWTNNNNQILFTISAFFDKDILTEMAKNIIVFEKK